MPTIAVAEVRCWQRPRWRAPVNVSILFGLALFCLPVRAAVPETTADVLGQLAGQALPLTINGRTVTVVSSTVDAATSWAMIQAVGRSAVPPAQPDKRNGRRADCALSGDASDPLVARMELNCNGWHVVFVRLCPKGHCRYDLISRQFLPVRATPSK